MPPTPPYVQTPLIFFSGMYVLHLGALSWHPHMIGSILTLPCLDAPMHSDTPWYPLMPWTLPHVQTSPCMSPMLPCASPICSFKTTTSSQSRNCSKISSFKTTTCSQSRNCSKAVLSRPPHPLKVGTVQNQFLSFYVPQCWVQHVQCLFLALNWHKYGNYWWYPGHVTPNDIMWHHLCN